MRLSLFGALDGRLIPAPDAGRVSFLLAQDFAHRGLWGGPVPENSLAAASAAIAGGFGIECDVRLARDGNVIVFHDADTQRLCGEGGTIADRTAREIAALRLSGSNEPVPTLAELLALIAGRVPLLIEIKTDTLTGTAALCLAVRRELEGYRGPVAVMGFNPEVAHWFARHAPRIVRGLVMTEPDQRRDAIMRRLAVRRASPDFLAYDIRFLPSPLPTALRARRVPILTWTPRTAEERGRAARHADRAIFEEPQALVAAQALATGQTL